MKTIIILLDCVRFDYLGCNGNDTVYTPTIDNLANNGCNFKQHFSVAPWTSPSVSSLLTGIYPHRLKIYKEHQSFPENVKSIFKYYKENKIHFGSFVKSKNFLGQDNESNESGYSWDINGMLKWIEKYNDEDYFLYLHYWNTHLPYFTKFSKEAWYKDVFKLIEILKKGDEREKFKVKELYKFAIERASEEFIYAIVEKLDKLNTLKDSLIIITADHGESWGERLKNKNKLDLFGMHGKYLYDEIIHIPLILYGKNIPSGEKIYTMTRNIDLFPTIIEANNWEVDNSSKYLEINGESLLPVINGEEKEDRECFISTSYLDKMQENIINEVIQKYAYRDKEWKVIYNKDSETYELYNLINDPGEKQNLIKKEIKIFNKYDEKLKSFLTSDKKVTEEEKEMIEKRLKHLGYI